MKKQKKINITIPKETCFFISVDTNKELELIDKENQIYMYKLRNDAFVHSCGCSIAMAYLLQGIDGTTYRTIMCDSNFDKLPGYVQKFIILHEIGHFVNGDENIPVKKRLLALATRPFGILPKTELNADKYAYSKINDKAKSALKFMLCKTDLRFLTKVELVKRIIKIDR